jgi:hypothetical protein
MRWYALPAVNRACVPRRALSSLQFACGSTSAVCVMQLDIAMSDRDRLTEHVCRSFARERQILALAAMLQR